MDLEQTASDRDNGADTTFSIRVARNGKIRALVKKALEFFQANPDRPLVLYSSPSEVSASTIPKLISVVEIIKREYLKGYPVGLHQFNELSFEDCPKRKLAPHMKITLCAKIIPEKPGQRETYQTPSVRKLSRAAKARMRQRAKRGADSQ
ncbi:hypothetical protein EDD15DRAFT_2161461 [Pisolithus albus]|nr:hypothetical protein EDD15DRAFT_2161461 [Pisolithus albus]